MAREEIWKRGGKYSWRAGKSKSKRYRGESGREREPSRWDSAAYLSAHEKHEWKQRSPCCAQGGHIFLVATRDARSEKMPWGAQCSFLLHCLISARSMTLWWSRVPHPFVVVILRGSIYWAVVFRTGQARSYRCARELTVNFLYGFKHII